MKQYVSPTTMGNPVLLAGTLNLKIRLCHFSGPEGGVRALTWGDVVPLKIDKLF